jgi:hypothetical protein
MTAQAKVRSGVSLLKDAIKEYLATRPEGVPASDMREELGLDSDTDPKGKHKGYLLWGVLNLLIQEGKVQIKRNCRPHRIVLTT